MKTYDYNGTKVFLQKEEYRNNGTLAVLMFKEDGELYGCITVNLNRKITETHCRNRYIYELVLGADRTNR